MHFRVRSAFLCSISEVFPWSGRVNRCSQWCSPPRRTACGGLSTCEHHLASASGFGWVGRHKGLKTGGAGFVCRKPLLSSQFSGTPAACVDPGAFTFLNYKLTNDNPCSVISAPLPLLRSREAVSVCGNGLEASRVYINWVLSDLGQVLIFISA